VERQGQGGFRRILLRAYEQRCAVTDCDLEDTLEAAHIVPYRGPVTNHPSNGLLLRADVHTLFDFGLVTINVEKGESRFLVSSEIQGSVYGRLNNTLVRRPTDHSLWPSNEALHQHRDRAGF
jgi:putative restriction endonuclease